MINPGIAAAADRAASSLETLDPHAMRANIQQLTIQLGGYQTTQGMDHGTIALYLVLLLIANRTGAI